jgi:hypothetical protein
LSRFKRIKPLRQKRAAQELDERQLRGRFNSLARACVLG